MSENKFIVVGGSIDKTLNGDTKLDLKKLLAEAWNLTATTKWVLVQSVLMVFSIALILVLIGLKAFAIDDLNNIPANTSLFLDMFLTAILAPMLTGIMVMGINHSVGGCSRPGHLFQFISKALLLGTTALMISVLIQLGLMLILPGIYIAAASSFALPLVVEKKLSPGQAIMLSIKAFNKFWLQLIIVYAAFLMAFVASLFTFGIALIWIAPLYYNMKGVLYRELFGVNVTKQVTTLPTANDESVFHA